MIKLIPVLLCAQFLFATYPQGALANLSNPKLSITKIPTPNLQVVGSNGERGAAITKLSDTKLLLGGGRNGSHLYLYDLSSKTEH
jgi:hypothetical protein